MRPIMQSEGGSTTGLSAESITDLDRTILDTARTVFAARWIASSDRSEAWA